MVNIIARKNKHEKITSYKFSINNYLQSVISLGGFKTIDYQIN